MYLKHKFAAFSRQFAFLRQGAKSRLKEFSRQFVGQFLTYKA